MTPLKPTAGLTTTVDHLDWARHVHATDLQRFAMRAEIERKA